MCCTYLGNAQNAKSQKMLETHEMLKAKKPK